MDKPLIYYVNGTVVAKDGEHVFKGTRCLCGASVHELQKISNVIELVPNTEGLYYLQEEGRDDYGENYLIASQGITAYGCKGEDGSIGTILSPIRNYNRYKENIQTIKDLSELKLDFGLERNLMRLLYIGVCGEMEGYLSSTIIALIQGVREVFLRLREFDNTLQQPDEHKWRDALVDNFNECYNYLSIKNRSSRERKIYEKLLGHELRLTQELIDDIDWRNKMTHRVAYYSKPIYPRKEDVLLFIEHANGLVDYIDKQIEKYKKCWLEELS